MRTTNPNPRLRVEAIHAGQVARDSKGTALHTQLLIKYSNDEDFYQAYTQPTPEKISDKIRGILGKNRVISP